MGTNYYLKKNVCKECGRGEELHIGKSSAGWHFGLQTYPDDNIVSLRDWKELFAENEIRDEYDRLITAKEMNKIITKRGRGEKWGEKPQMYKSWAEFHRINHSGKGLNGLLKHKVDGRFCVRNGEGTYDYMIGEFS